MPERICMEKFRLLSMTPLILVVPENHVVVNEFAGGHFPNPSRVLRPGDRFRVHIYQQVVETTTGEEKLEFLDSLGSKYLGAQGARLVHYRLFRQLPNGLWFSSLDEPGRLWIDKKGRVRVPEIPGNLNQAFSLGYFNTPSRENHALLSFT